MTPQKECIPLASLGEEGLLRHVAKVDDRLGRQELELVQKIDLCSSESSKGNILHS